jgi:hypothetical protein
MTANPSLRVRAVSLAVALVAAVPVLLAPVPASAGSVYPYPLVGAELALSPFAGPTGTVVSATGHCGVLQTDVEPIPANVYHWGVALPDAGVLIGPPTDYGGLLGDLVGFAFEHKVIADEGTIAVYVHCATDTGSSALHWYLPPRTFAVTQIKVYAEGQIFGQVASGPAWVGSWLGGAVDALVSPVLPQTSTTTEPSASQTPRTTPPSGSTAPMTTTTTDPCRGPEPPRTCR